METCSPEDRKWVDKSADYSILEPALEYVVKSDGKWYTFYRGKGYWLKATTQDEAKKECENIIRGILKAKVKYYTDALNLLPDEVK